MSVHEAVYREAEARLRRRAGLRARRRGFRVRFAKYAGLTSSIYDRGDHVEVRLSDVMSDAPMAVHYALAMDLLARLDNRLPLRSGDVEAYQQWVRSDAVRRAHAEARKAKARSRLVSPRGRVYDLRALYRRLNREYFRAMLPQVQLGWSEGTSRTRFGYHDDDLGTIVINRRLDSATVPQVVVAYVLYHEMLHVQFGVGYADDGRRVMHPPEFQAAERRFPAHGMAERFLQRLAAAAITSRVRPKH